MLAGLFALPVGRLIWTALTEPTPTFSHVSEVFTDPASRRAFTTTFVTSAIVTVFAICLGAVLAWELRSTSRRWKRTLIWAAVLFPMWSSIIVRNYAFTILLQREGVVNETLQFAQLTDQPIDFLYTQGAIAVGMLHYMLPFAVLPLYAGFSAIDLNLIRAAESLGASRIRALRTVVIPLALPSIMAAAAIVFVICLGFYVTPILLGGPTTPFVATLVSQQVFTFFDIPLAAATSSVLFLITAVIVLIAWRVVGAERLRRAVA